jgi:hypothetical protein
MADPLGESRLHHAAGDDSRVEWGEMSVDDNKQKGRDGHVNGDR